MITFEDIQKANEGLQTMNIKGKDYVQVNQRIKAFKRLYPEGFIITDIINLDGGICTMTARCGYYTEDGKQITLGTGTAQEKETSSYINKTSYIENCETSAVGRALGNAGLGIDVSIASAEEMNNACRQQMVEQEECVICECCHKPITSVIKRDGSPWKVTDMAEYSSQKYGKKLCGECMKAEDKARKGKE